MECDDLELKDIEGTSLIDAFEVMGFDYYDEDYLNEILEDVLSLPEELPKEYYCMATIEGIFFFENEEDFRRAYERTDCDYKLGRIK